MKKYQLIKSVKYKFDHSKPVSLLEYQIYKEDNKRFVLFKFINNEKDILNDFKFELTSYDKQGNPLIKETYNFDNLEINNNQEFVPGFKIYVDENMDELEFEIIEAEYLTNSWIDGFWVKEISKEQQEELEERKEQEIIKNNITYIDTKRRRFPLIVPIIAFFAIILLFTINLNKFNNEVGVLFEYDIVNDKAVILDYHGTNLDLVIPRTIDGYEVVEVASGAFQYSYFRTVTFEGEITIRFNAFSDSPFLSQINGAGFELVDDYAFSNLRSLKTVNSYGRNNIASFAFYNTKRLKRFEFNYIGNFDYDIRNLTPEERYK